MSSTQLTQQQIAKLDETNYTSWKFKMRMVLELHDLWDVVDGTEFCPEEMDGAACSVVKEEVQAYQKRARKAYVLIAMALSDPQLAHIRSFTTGKEAWEKLSEVHEAKGLAARLFLRRKFFTLAKAVDDSMQQHIVKVTTMAEHLAAIGATVSEEDTVMTLLCSLPPDFDNLIVSLESRVDNLTLDYVQPVCFTRKHAEPKRSRWLAKKQRLLCAVKTSGAGKREREIAAGSSATVARSAGISRATVPRICRSLDGAKTGLNRRTKQRSRLLTKMSSCSPQPNKEVRARKFGLSTQVLPVIRARIENGSNGTVRSLSGR